MDRQIKKRLNRYKLGVHRYLLLLLVGGMWRVVATILLFLSWKWLHSYSGKGAFPFGGPESQRHLFSGAGDTGRVLSKERSKIPNGQTIVFDLDGTLGNPRKGIVKSINFALGGLGKKPLPEAALTRFIGPPLKEIFLELLGTGDENTLTKAIHLFRQRYFDIGHRENRLYDGIPSLPSTLKGDGSHLYIATAKREDIARKVAGHFRIVGYFNGIFGCDLDTPQGRYP